MLVNTFYYSYSDVCGISIFNGHLGKALSRIGISVLNTNLRTTEGSFLAPIGILNYVPGSFASAEAARALIKLLASFRDPQQLFVILHGLHSYGESRFPDGNIYPQHEQHVRLVLERSEGIIALSGSTARAYDTWRVRFGGPGTLIRLDHPGLFKPIGIRSENSDYALIGGISRTKKVYAAPGISELLDACRCQDIRVWEHWSNVSSTASLQRSWRQTFGPLNDLEWSTLISNARVVLCPYQTKVQSVSGMMSEALSAGRFVISTSFDLALEMREQNPALVFVEDDLHEWPNIIKRLQGPDDFKCTVPSWNSFAAGVASEMSSRQSQKVGQNERAQCVSAMVGHIPSKSQRDRFWEAPK